MNPYELANLRLREYSGAIRLALAGKVNIVGTGPMVAGNPGTEAPRSHPEATAKMPHAK